MFNDAAGQQVHTSKQKMSTTREKNFFFLLTWDSVDCFEGTEHPHGPNGGQVDVL